MAGRKVASAPLRNRLRERLAHAGSAPTGEAWLAGLPPELSASFNHLMPVAPIPAAVLVPIVDHSAGLTVLLTERAADLKNHAGQISFPGGRIEAIDDGPVAAALRETHEEIGLEARYIDVFGYLPDHLIISGYRVTPVVASDGSVDFNLTFAPRTTSPTGGTRAQTTGVLVEATLEPTGGTTPTRITTGTFGKVTTTTLAP